MGKNNLSELQKMITGELYNPLVEELIEKRSLARQALKELGSLPYEAWDEKRQIYSNLFGDVGNHLTIEQPFICDYGFNIFFGDQVFLNFDCILLDSAPINIGNRVMLAPSVRIYTATHPLDHQRRNSGQEFAKPVTIGDDVWLGGSVIVNPGVKIGARSVIGSGSVVVKDIPSDVLAAGNPARVIKAIGLKQ